MLVASHSAQNQVPSRWSSRAMNNAMNYFIFIYHNTPTLLYFLLRRLHSMSFIQPLITIYWHPKVNVEKMTMRGMILFYSLFPVFTISSSVAPCQGIIIDSHAINTYLFYLSLFPRPAFNPYPQNRCCNNCSLSNTIDRRELQVAIIHNSQWKDERNKPISSGCAFSSFINLFLLFLDKFNLATAHYLVWTPPARLKTPPAAVHSLLMPRITTFLF